MLGDTLIVDTHQFTSMPTRMRHEYLTSHVRLESPLSGSCVFWASSMRLLNAAR
jgi:hypothetical protein